MVFWESYGSKSYKSINWRESTEKNDLSGTGIISSKNKKLPWFVHDKKYDWIPHQTSL